MKSIARTATAVALSLGLALASASAVSAKGKKTGRILGGIAAGVAGAIILNEIAKDRQYEERRYYSRPQISCRELDERCYDGQEWACRKFDRYC